MTLKGRPVMRSLPALRAAVGTMALMATAGLLTACQVSVQDAQPRAAVEATDQPAALEPSCSWIEDRAAAVPASTTDNGTYTVSQADETVRLRGRVSTVTVTGANAEVYADHIDTLVIEGANADVSVCSVGVVQVRPQATNADIEWGSASTPDVRDEGTNTDAAAHQD